jgi:hypothetical protein
MEVGPVQAPQISQQAPQISQQSSTVDENGQKASLASFIIIIMRLGQ